MNRLQKTTQGNSKLLVSYLVAGYPQISWTVALMNKLVDAGSDIIELGIPFSDPMADGPIISSAHGEALQQPFKMLDIFEIVKNFRLKKPKTPLIIMSYLNPIETFSTMLFFEKLQQSGGDGLLLVDAPYDEQLDLPAGESVKDTQLARIQLISPTTPLSRQREIISVASGFIYLISIKGITGQTHINLLDLKKQVKDLKGQTLLPVCVGFGIKTPKLAQKVAKFADGVVVGSSIIELINKRDKEISLKNIGTFIRRVRHALDYI